MCSVCQIRETYWFQNFVIYSTMTYWFSFLNEVMRCRRSPTSPSSLLHRNRRHASKTTACQLTCMHMRACFGNLCTNNIFIFCAHVIPKCVLVCAKVWISQELWFANFIFRMFIHKSAQHKNAIDVQWQLGLYKQQTIQQLFCLSIKLRWWTSVLSFSWQQTMWIG